MLNSIEASPGNHGLILGEATQAVNRTVNGQIEGQDHNVTDRKSIESLFKDRSKSQLRRYAKMKKVVDILRTYRMSCRKETNHHSKRGGVRGKTSKLRDGVFLWDASRCV